jgi:trk system potassium uptake protein TrkA
MDIIVAGAGTVGYSLAQILSHKHNVIVVDKEVQTLNRLDDDIDVMTLHGNIEDPKTFQKLNSGTMDLFIAVTDSDEANLLSTLIIDDVINVKKKIIRLKNSYFKKSAVLEKLDIDDAIFPDDLTADKFESLFTHVKANNVKNFKQTKLQLVSIKVECEKNNEIRLSSLINDNLIVLGIERDKKYFTPLPSESIQESDLIYFFGQSEEIEATSFKLNNKMPSKIKNVAIFGANILAQKIAQRLLTKNLNIKMIDKNIKHCKMASELLQDRVTIINSAYDDHHLFEDEGLKNADMIIAAGPDDEKNIVKCVEAREYGIEKVVAINNDKAYYGLMHKLGIVVVRGSKIGAYYAILEKIASSNVVTERHFCGGQAVLFKRRVNKGSKLIGKSISIRSINNCLIYLIREEKLMSLNRELEFNEGDIIIVSANVREEEKIQKWIVTL